MRRRRCYRLRINCNSSGDEPLSQNDPTDSALAAIASIFGPARQPAAEGDPPQADPSQAEPSQADQPQPDVVEADSAATAALAPDPGIDGYSRSGPGPLDSLRFKWTARRGEDGAYYVDETIGYASRPISTGPIPRDEVVAFIDQREQQARQRFDALRNEMIHGAAEPAARDDDDGPIESEA